MTENMFFLVSKKLLLGVYDIIRYENLKY